ncbi:helix-turn-helix transcriptional regulator [Bacteroides caecimuris]|uniref:helix-turn-helix transcriptional regulator n=1 Tax=Bacteroides caecimuris TaxID=1796613 RepID=UPI001C3D5679|nr:WYL domain-containing protein [Bacteroides caecimuris]
MAKDLFNRYLWLVDTIYRAGTITLDEINRKWLQCEMSNGEEIPNRTFHNHRKAIEELFDINIECDRHNCNYYIENTEELKKEGLRKWLLNTFAVNTTLNKSHKLKDKILLEDYPSGEQYLIPAIEAIHNCITLEITYQSYWQDKSYTFQIEPYCIKAFKQRWYIAARSPYYNKVLIYSLERILEMEQTDLSFECPQTFNPKVYFDNSFGVIVDEEYDVEKIRIKVYGNQCKYFRSLPLHHSQKESETHSNYSIFTYRLRPTYDFCQAILSHGTFVEVLEPQWFRIQIGTTIQKMHQLYE